MDIAEVILVGLQLFHALAALIWLGGGIFFLIVIRPLGNPAVTKEAGQQFAEWAKLATVVLIVTGVVLMFDGLSSGKGGLLYAGLLALKVLAAVIAFWAVGFRSKDRPRTKAEIIVALGLFSFTIGILLSAVWPE